MKKYIFAILFVFCSCFVCSVSAGTYVSKYGNTLSRSERESLCNSLYGASQTASSERNGLGGGVIPDEVLTSIYNTTRNISNSVMLISILGDTLMCHSVHAAKENLEMFGIYLGSYPNIPIWLCGAVIYFFGFMLLLSITFYVVDISFKLGFAIILMPIGIALWPFEKTKDKIVILISIFLKSAAIFSFLAITTAYTVGMLSEALSDLKEIFEAIAQNNTDYIAETFTLDAKTFFLVIAALAYGMKLIGSTVPQYVDKFFPDKAFGSASPMHHLSTQAMDFAKQKVVAPIAKYAGNVAETQIGKGVEKVGRFARGEYHENIKSGIKNIGIAVRNPIQTAKKAQLAIAHGETKVITGAMKKFNNLKYGAQIAAAGFVPNKDDRRALRDQIRNKRDEKNDRIDQAVEENYQNARKNIDEEIQNRNDERERRHEEKMRTDPAYKERVMRRQAVKQKISDGKEAIHNWNERRNAKIGALDQRLADIDKAKESHKANVDKVFGAMDDFADKIKKGKGTARLLQGIKKTKEKAFASIDTGKCAKNEADGWFKKGYKAVGRGIQKAGVTLAMVPAQIPLGIVSGTVNAGINTVNTAAKFVSGAAMGVYNGAVSTVYGVKKIPTSLKRAFKKIPDAAVDVLQAPGTILKSTGQAMQDHRDKKK